MPNHIPDFSIPTLRMFYDRRPNHARGNPRNAEMDNSKIAALPWVAPLIPEPATFALLGLGRLLMLRRNV